MTESGKTVLLWCIAALCGIGAAYMLYRIEASYCHTLRMNWVIWSSSGIGASIGMLLTKKSTPQKKLTQKQKIGIYLALIVKVSCICAVADLEEMRIFPYQMIVLLLPSFWADTRIEKGANCKCIFAQDCIISIFLLTVVSFGAPKALGYVTMTEAGTALTAQGYEDIAFARTLRGNWLLYEAEDDSFYQEKMAHRMFYLFHGKKAGESWVMVIDPTDGKTLIAAPATDEPSLAE